MLKKIMKLMLILLCVSVIAMGIWGVVNRDAVRIGFSVWRDNQRPLHIRDGNFQYFEDDFNAIIDFLLPLQSDILQRSHGFLFIYVDDGSYGLRMNLLDGSGYEHINLPTEIQHSLSNIIYVFRREDVAINRIVVYEEDEGFIFFSDGPRSVAIVYTIQGTRPTFFGRNVVRINNHWYQVSYE